MSGVEVVGFALGILAALEQALEAAENLRYRYHAYSRNGQQIARLLQTYYILISHLRDLRAQYDGKSCELSDENRRVFEHHMTSMLNAFHAATATLNRMHAAQSRNAVARYLKATTTRDRLDALEADAQRAVSFVAEINSFLATADVVAHVAERQTSAIVSRIDDLERTVSHHYEEPCASFVVPCNPSVVQLEYDAVNDAGEPASCEALLLRAVLRGGVVAAVGMGGVGKSCALRGLAEHAAVRRTFTGGVYYMNLGMDARNGIVVEQAAEIMELSGARESAKEVRWERSIGVALGRLRKWFEGRDCLFLVDDVWLVNDIDWAFLSKMSALAGCSRRSALAYTTRDRKLASFGEPVFFTPRETFGEQSRRILLRAARFAISELLEDASRRAIDVLLSICGGLPVALAVVGNAVFLLSNMYNGQRERAWARYLSTQTSCSERLVKADIHEYPGLAATFSTALHVLTDHNARSVSDGMPLSFREMHRALCVLQKQGCASSSMLRRLWRLHTGAVAIEIAHRFEQVSLVDIEVREMNGKEEEIVRLHDLVQEFCTLQAAEFEGASYWHAKLLDAYISSRTNQDRRRENGCRAWWAQELANDSYLGANLCRHLVGAGRQEELLQLVTHPKWTRRQLVAHGILQVEQDFDIVICSIADRRDWLSPGDDDTVRDLRLIAQAVRLSHGYLLHNPAEFGFQMYNRLLPLKTSSRMISSYVTKLEESADSVWAKPLKSFLPLPGGPMRTTIVCESRANCVSLFGQDNMAIGGCADGTVVILNTESGEVVKKLEGHTGAVRCIGVVKAEEVAISGSEDTSLRRWNLQTGSQIGDPLCGHSEAVSCIAVSEDGLFVVTGSYDKTTRVWDIKNGRQLFATSPNPKACIRCVGISRDGKKYLTGADDQTVRVRSMETGEEIGDPMRGHTDHVVCMAVIDEKHVVSGSGDETVRVWNFDTRDQTIGPLRGHTHRVMNMALTDDRKRVVTVSRDKTIRIWDLEVGCQVGDALVGHTRRITDVSVSANGDRIVTCSFDKTVRVWEIGARAAAKHTAARGHRGWIRCVDVTPDGSRLATGSMDKTARVWDTRSGEQICVLQSQSDCVNCMALSRDGETVVTASKDGTAQVWDVETARAVCDVLRGHSGPIVSLAVSRDAKVVVTGSEDNTARVWTLSEADDDYRCTVLEGHTDHVICVGLSPNGDLLATGSMDKSARVWNLETGEQACGPLVGHRRPVSCVTFSADAEHVITGSKDKSIQVWRVDTGASVFEPLEGHRKEVKRVVPIPYSASLVISLSLDESVRVWDISRGECIRFYESTSARFFPLQELLLFVEDSLADGDRIGSIHLEHAKVMMGKAKKRRHLATLESPANIAFLSAFTSVICVTTWNFHTVFLHLENT